MSTFVFDFIVSVCHVAETFFYILNRSRTKKTILKHGTQVKDQACK